MADFVSKASRSRIMAAILGKGNRTTEVALGTVLRAYGLRGWRRHVPLPGTPDFTWSRQRVAVFVDGCFWHGCPQHYRAPTTRPAFWAAKLKHNRSRARRVAAELRGLGWHVIRVWECRVMEESTLRRLQEALDIPGCGYCKVGSVGRRVNH